MASIPPGGGLAEAILVGNVYWSIWLATFVVRSFGYTCTMATDGLNLKSCSRGSRGWGCSSLVKERGRRSPVSACVSQKYRSTKKYTWNYKYMTWDFELSTELVRDDIIIQWAYRNTYPYVRSCFSEVECGTISIECTILRWKARKSHLDNIHSNVKSTIAKKVTTRIYKNVHLQINFFVQISFAW